MFLEALTIVRHTIIEIIEERQLSIIPPIPIFYVDINVQSGKGSNIVGERK